MTYCSYHTQIKGTQITNSVFCLCVFYNPCNTKNEFMLIPNENSWTTSEGLLLVTSTVLNTIE